MKLAFTTAWIGCCPSATGVAVLAAAVVRAVVSTVAVVVDWELTSSKLISGPRRELSACAISIFAW